MMIFSNRSLKGGRADHDHRLIMIVWLLLVAGALVAYLVVKAVQLYGADADLTVLGSKMKPQYFQGRVVWVTGASSGSKYRQSSTRWSH